ncbi:MAG TPA: immunoglobulin-like domain-containing protein, partial [Pyrinomonadaceae bacterium]|nr:immunoglobulin-like domain-containing protein [Pyrinomonadaceae bacterium]
MNSPKSHETLSTSTTRKNKLTYGKNLIARVSGILILFALVVSGLYLGAGATATSNPPKSEGFAARNVKTTLPNIDLGGSSPLVNWLAPVVSPQANEVTLATYAGDCTTPKTVYNLQDTDLTVCAKFTNAASAWRVIWSNAHFVAVQNAAVNNTTSATFTLNPNSSLGDWRVILFEPFGGTVQAVVRFTVVDEANPSADVSVSKGLISSAASSGHQLLYSLQVTNYGPSDAASVQLSDGVPANTTFHSFGQLSGPTFNCTSPNEGETGTTNCTITSLARGETAIFVATYVIDTVSSGTVISNTATASSTTPDPNTDNNSSTADVTVVNAPCQLSTPENITTDADAGQAGAVVSYATPTGTGDCGTASTGENGETIPAISCNPPSGSFFPVGTTTVICTAKTGSAVSFQVTVNNPGTLSISLNGPASITLECGQRFGDPAATAVNASGQNLEVTVSYSNGFDPDAPAVGTYTATYTATEGANSVSAERTITVTDTEAPAITIAGANPYKIQQGSCSPFVDPGASAFDTCDGSKPVTS